ncbi:MAG: hypothetical protein HY961_14615 [Ignavibacteriae bacterium]|nr:hypothetical protein [Ignavibacteriota bacterium]
MKRIAFIATLAAGLLTVGLTGRLSAQEKEHHHKAPHGGLVVTVGKDYHFELVVKEKELNLYVLDAKEKALSVKDVSGDIVVLMGKEKKTMKLSPSGDFLKASGDFTKAEKFTAVATVKLRGKNETGRFVYTKAVHHDEMQEKHHDEKDEHHDMK